MKRSRLALTTTRDRGRRLAEVVVARGFQPVLLPCIEITRANDDVLNRARATARDADWIVITSPRTVTALWPSGGMPEVRVAAVGRRTAQAVERAGGVVETVGEVGAGVLLERLLERLDGTVFFPHGAASAPSTAERIRELGVRTVSMAVYETHPISPGFESVEAALFGSPSAVTGWSLSRGFNDLTVAAIGPTTAGALEGLGHPPQLVASRPDYETLIDVVAGHLNASGPS